MKILVHNIATEYRVDGTGPVLLFLHGWKDSLHTFDAVTELLKDRYTVIRLDLPGFGGSETPPDPWHLIEYVRFLKAFTEKMGVDVAVLTGHSFGGRVAIKAVAENTMQPHKLILIASAGIAKTRTARSRLFAVIAKAGKVLTNIPPLRSYRQRLRHALYARVKSDYFHSGELKETFLYVIHEDLRSSAAKITVPTLVLWGSADTITPLADGRTFAHCIPNAQLKIIDGAGHLVHQEQPQRIAELIRQFVS